MDRHDDRPPPPRDFGQRRDERRWPNKRDRSPDNGPYGKRVRRTPSPPYRDSRDHRDPRDFRGRMSGGFRGGDMQDNSRTIPDPFKLDYMVSFGQFSEYACDVHSHQRKHMAGRGGGRGDANQLDTTEIEQRYDAYREDFTRRQHQKFFEAHKAEEWFREKYHPETSAVFLETLVPMRVDLLRGFVASLESGKLDDVCFDETVASKVVSAVTGPAAPIPPTLAVTSTEIVTTAPSGDADASADATDAKESKDEDKAEPAALSEPAKPEPSTDDGPADNATGAEAANAENGDDATPDASASVDAPADAVASVDEVTADKPETDADAVTRKEDDQSLKAQEPTENPVEPTATPAAPAANTDKQCALFIKGVSVLTPRSAILAACQGTKGFKYLALSDPRLDKKMTRLGWIVFDLLEDLEPAFAALEKRVIDEHTKLQLVICQAGPEIRERIVPPEANEPSRLAHDLDQIKRLAAVLDAGAKFDADSGAAMVEAHLNKMFADASTGDRIAPASEMTVVDIDHEDTMRNIRDDDEDDELEGKHKDDMLAHGPDAVTVKPAMSTVEIKKRLDFYIDYLRVVHTYDYYGGIESVAPEDHMRRSGRYLRKPYTAGLSSTGASGALGSTNSAKESRRETYLGRLDKRVQIRISKPTSGPLLIKMGGRDADEEVDRLVNATVLKEAQGKFRCRECSKLFKGEEYVQKHVRSKHPETYDAVAAEISFYNNYVLDFEKIDTTRASAPSVQSNGDRDDRDERDMRDRVHPRDGRVRENFHRDRRLYDLPRDEFGRVIAPPAMPPSPFGGMAREEYGRGGGGGRRMDGPLPPPFVPSGSPMMPPPPRGGPRRSDPRQIRSYCDLDAPVGGDIELNYD